MIVTKLVSLIMAVTNTAPPAAWFPNPKSEVGNTYSDICPVMDSLWRVHSDLWVYCHLQVAKICKLTVQRLALQSQAKLSHAHELSLLGMKSPCLFCAAKHMRQVATPCQA